MNGLTVAVTSYVIAIVISFVVAGLIHCMGLALNRFSKKAGNTNQESAVMLEASNPVEAVSDDPSIAAVIAIVKNAA